MSGSRLAVALDQIEAELHDAETELNKAQKRVDILRSAASEVRGLIGVLTDGGNGSVEPDDADDSRSMDEVAGNTPRSRTALRDAILAALSAHHDPVPLKTIVKAVVAGGSIDPAAYKNLTSATYVNLRRLVLDEGLVYKVGSQYVLKPNTISNVEVASKTEHQLVPTAHSIDLVTLADRRGGGG